MVLLIYNENCIGFNGNCNGAKLNANMSQKHTTGNHYLMNLMVKS